MNSILTRKQQYVVVILSVISLSLLVGWATAYGVTTISTNIDTGGTLTVSGASTLTGNVAAGGSLSVTGALYATGTVVATGELKTYGGVTFNDDGGDNDFRAEGDSDANLLILDASADRVGIGTSTPRQKLSVQGNALFSGDLSLANLTATGTLNITGLTTLVNASSTLTTVSNTLWVNSKLFVGTTTSDRALAVHGDALIAGTTTVAHIVATGTTQFGGVIYTWPSSDGSSGQTLSTNGSGVLSWAAGGAFNSSGGFTTLGTITDLVGIGTSTPSQKLSVQGNALFSGDLSLANLTATGTLNITGLTTLVNASSTLTTVSNTLWVNSKLFVGTTTSDRALAVHGDAIISGTTTLANLTATGTVLLAGSTNTTQLVIKANSSQSNTNPLVKLQNSAGTDLMWLHSDNSNNIFIGVNAGRINAPSGNDGVKNIFIGEDAGYTTAAGHDNVFIGYQAGYKANASENVAIGTEALEANTSGNYNTAVGYNALLVNTSGGGNTAIGCEALRNNAGAGGQKNTAVGYEAGLGTYNKAIDSNVIIGWKAGYALDTGGNNNVLLGYQAGDSITTGQDNIIIGYDEDTPAATTDYHLNIGGLIYGDLSGRKIGIATSSPASLFSVSATTTTATTTFHLGTKQSTTHGSCIQMYTPSGSAYRLYVANDGTLTTEAGGCE